MCIQDVSVMEGAALGSRNTSKVKTVVQTAARNLHRAPVPPLLLRSCLLQIIIPAQNLTSALSEVKGRHLWGTDIYTDDSDLLCALMHCGYYNATLKKPVSSIAEMNVIIQLMPPQQTYPNYTRNGIRPRAWWVGGTTCSYKVSLRLTGRKEKSMQ